MMNLKHEKERLRNECKNLRASFSEKQKKQYDKEIFKRLISLYQYRDSSLILTYVSKDIEVDTIKLIEKALSDGKQVAVPKCIAGTRNMDFYFITGFDCLEKSTFGVLEPITDICRRTESFENSVCIVPGMSFDIRGYRLGYGKGYYDRFLSGYNGTKVGLCYSNCVKWKLPNGKYDETVDILVTERYFRKIKNPIK